MTTHIHPEIHDAIDAEFQNLYEQGRGLTPRSHKVSDGDALAFLVSSVGRAASAMQADDDGLYLALIQTAAVAAAWAERLEIAGDL